VLERPIRILAIVACGIVTMSFALFVVDQSRSASNLSATEIAQSGPPVTPGSSAKQPKPKPAHRTTAEQARHIVDQANHSLVSPVDWVVPAHANDWVTRGVPWILAMLLYGFGLGYLARFARGRA
jgi:hypothetical protein